MATKSVLDCPVCSARHAVSRIMCASLKGAAHLSPAYESLTIWQCFKCNWHFYDDDKTAARRWHNKQRRRMAERLARTLRDRFDGAQP